MKFLADSLFRGTLTVEKKISGINIATGAIGLETKSASNGGLNVYPHLTTAYGVYFQAIDSAGTANIPMSFASSKFIFENGNLIVGGNTDAGYKADIVGTLRSQSLRVQTTSGNATSITLANQDGTVLSTYGTDNGASAYLTSFYNLTITPNTSAAGGGVIIGTGSYLGYLLDVKGTLASDTHTIISSSSSGLNMTIGALGYAQHRVTGGYGTEYIEFGGPAGNRTTVNGNEVHLSAGTVLLNSNSSIQVGGTTGVTFNTTGVIQQGDTRAGVTFTSAMTSATASGTSNLFQVRLTPSLGTSVGTINAYGISVQPTINTTGGTTVLRGYYYNPAITGSTGLTNIAFESTSGIVKISTLSGSGSRMVIADSAGVLSTQAIPSATGLQSAVDTDKTSSGSLSVGTSTVKSVSASTYSGVFFDYVVKNGTNVRVGSVVAITNGTDIEYYETLSNDIGTTTGITFAVDLSGGNIRLRATTTATGWTVIVSTRGI